MKELTENFNKLLNSMEKYGFKKENDFINFSSFFNAVFKFCLSENKIERLQELKNIVDQSRFLFGENSVYLADIITSFIVELRFIKHEENNLKDKQFIYLLQNKNLIKIGRTTDLKRRICALRISAPDAILLAYKESLNYTEEESYWHKYFHNKKYKREWFLLNKNDLSECRNKGFIFINKAIYKCNKSEMEKVNG